MKDKVIMYRYLLYTHQFSFIDIVNLQHVIQFPGSPHCGFDFPNPYHNALSETDDILCNKSVNLV